VDSGVVQAIDVWPARRWEIGWRQHAGSEQRGGLGEVDPDRWAPSASDCAHGKWEAGRLTREDGQGSVQSWADCRENDPK
jgi:hypothetical protein